MEIAFRVLRVGRLVKEIVTESDKRDGEPNGREISDDEIGIA